MGQIYNSFILAIGLALLFTKQLTSSTVISIDNNKVELAGVTSICGAIICVISVMNFYSKKQIDISLSKDQH